MPLLSSSIVKHQLASVQEVEDALARQSSYGGDLLTNLLEIHPLREEQVAAALAESFGLQPAPIGELPRPADRVRRLVPADVAQRFACVPLEENDGTLILAVSEPLPAEVENDLGFALGVTIEQRIASLARVRQAVAREYGVALDGRFARALARLEGRPDPNPTQAPPPVEAATAQSAAISPVPPTVASEPRQVSHGPTKSEFKALVRATRPEPPKVRRLGPYTAAMAERDLLAAQELEDAMSAFFGFAEQYFEYAALFAVHADLAEGRDAHGPGAPRARVQSIGVPLDLPSALASARDAESHKLVRLAASGLDAALAKDLERRPGPLVLLLPISVRGRTVLILYGDHGDSDVDLTTVGDVISFAPLVAATLERLIVKRKRGRPEAGGIGALVPPRPPRQPLPSVEERAEALVSVLGVRLTSRPPFASPATTAPASAAPPPAIRTEKLPGPGGTERPLAPAESHAPPPVAFRPELPRGPTGTEPPLGPTGTEPPARLIAQENAGAPTSSPPTPPTLQATVSPEESRPSQHPAARTLLSEPAPAALREGGSREPPLVEIPAPKAAERTWQSGPLPAELAAALSEPPAPRPVTPNPLDDPSFAWSAPPPAPNTQRMDPTESGPPGSALGRPVAPSTTLAAVTTRSSAPPRSIAEALARPVIAVGVSSPSPVASDPPGPVVAREDRTAHSLPPAAVQAGWGEVSGGSSPYERREVGTRPGIGTAPAQAEEKRPEDSSPHVSVEATPLDDETAALAAQGAWTEVDSPGVPLASTSRMAAHSARPLAARANSDELKLPTVIVNVKQDCQDLLSQLLAGDASASDRLVAAGASAVPVLVAAFPGPIEIPSSRRPNAAPRASECGPVLKTLAKLGLEAVPFLVVRTNDTDPMVRSWATRLLGEIPTPESAHAVARRFFDGDVDVRRAALAAARLLTSAPDTISALVAELGMTAEDRGKPTSVRLTAMDMLAELRQSQAVPFLVLALQDNPIDIVQSARRALVTLTRQDFGAVPHTWSEWWRGASGRHRIEWLIDSLTHEQGEIRRAAGEELKALTREYFGYYDDLPPPQRLHAQKKYREWWDTKGKARFR
jgi:hypothetical protein